MNTLQIILLIVCSVLAIVFIAIRAKFGGLLGVMLKTLASFAFVATAIITMGTYYVDSSTRITLSIFTLGFLLGMIGDILLDLKVVYPGNDKYYLNAGMLSFGLGHLAYFSAFSMYAVNKFSTDLLMPILVSVGAGILLTVAIILVSKKMKLEFGDYLIQTIVYSFLLTFMTVYTLILSILGGAMWLGFVGMLLFFLSDIVLSMQYFGGKLESKLLIIVNHGLYYSAQIVLVAVLMLL